MSIQKFRNVAVLFLGFGVFSGDLLPVAAANAKDENAAAVTAESQAMSGANAKSEAETLRLIRQDIVAADSLSTQAKNVRIIVIKNLITLRGVVESQAERAEIVRISKAVAPNHRIENRMTATN